MTSERKKNTNRANACLSSGPRTVQGRARTAGNALRHALSLPVAASPALSEEVEALARAIAGPTADAISLEFARQVAEAQVDLRRVRHARHQFLTNTMSNPTYDSRANVLKIVKILGQFIRPDAPEMSSEDWTELVTAKLQGPQKLAMILSQETKQLLAMDRYERRAWSRRKFAVRAFDAARRQSSTGRELLPGGYNTM